MHQIRGRGEIARKVNTIARMVGSLNEANRLAEICFRLQATPTLAIEFLKRQSARNPPDETLEEYIQKRKREFVSDRLQCKSCGWEMTVETARYFGWCPRCLNEPAQSGRALKRCCFPKRERIPGVDIQYHGTHQADDI